MHPVFLFLIPLLASLLFIPLLPARGKGICAWAAVLSNSLFSGYLAWQTLLGRTYMILLPGNLLTGEIPLRMDALSGWFLLMIHFVFVTGGFYGIFYMKAYRDQQANLSLHAISFVFLHASLTGLCVIQNGMVFLIAWEVMTLSAFLTVIFEHEHWSTIRAGLNYLIQSHLSFLCLLIAFVWAAGNAASYDFDAIKTYSAGHPGAASLFLFLCFFLGFAIKAGFVPFHTWLPYAHPAAPAHISGILSGVIIKIGIYGILRMILLIRPDFLILGYIILAISFLSGLYGVMLATRQHHLKKLLAYHSIENIGIIGIGIGLGCIGLGTNQALLASLGFSGAMLHTLNHSLFKSLLFFTAGNVYQATHTMNLDRLGGVIKMMPQTAALFLMAAVAICGIPPLNGFISEFLIYNGLYHWLQNAHLVPLVVVIFSILCLVMIGGFALLCFTKAFGIVFLGSARRPYSHSLGEISFLQLLPLYLIATAICAIGLFPRFFLNQLVKPVELFTGSLASGSHPFQGRAFDAIQSLSIATWLFLLLLSLMFCLRFAVLRTRKQAVADTWGCGYLAPSARLQYTAGSYVRTYSKLFDFVFTSSRSVTEVEGVFPTGARYATHTGDKIEMWLISVPLQWARSQMGRFLFLHNGKLQLYILYGIIFILAVIYLPVKSNGAHDAYITWKILGPGPTCGGLGLESHRGRDDKITSIHRAPVLAVS